MKFGRIALVILAVPFAWRWGPALLDGIGNALPEFGSLLSYLTPGIGEAFDVGHWFKFLIGIALFWLLFKLLGLTLGFMAPKAQQFQTTKGIRRFQGVCAEACLLAISYGLVYLARGFINWLPLDVALIVWLVFRRPLKEGITSLYNPVMRFLHKGRFGMGGSARFIGLIEEWALRWRPPRRPWLESAQSWSEGPGAFSKMAAALFQANDIKGLLDEARQAQSGKLFIGRSLYSRTLHIGLKDDRHMITLAGSRAGKFVSCIAPNLLSFEGSVLCIDPKGEAVKITARRRREMGQAVYIVDPFHLVTEKSDCFNPLEVLDPGSLRIREALSGVADALVVHDGANKMMGSHWEDGARSVLTGYMAQLITDPQYRRNGTPPNLCMIRDLLALNEDQRLGLLADMSENRGAGDAARDIAARMIRGVHTEEITNIVSNADKHSEWLSYPSMRGILTSTTFRFAELKEKPTTIYLVIPPELLDTHKRFLRLFINLALAQMPMGGRSKIPVLMIIDEFLQLGKMASVERAFRLLAGYNFVVWPFIQDLAGLKDLYGEGMNAFLTNTRAVQVFGVNDDVSLKYVCEQIGERSMQYVMGTGDSTRSTYLRTPKEASIEIRKDGDLQYLLRAGEPSVILERVKYFEDKNGNFLPRNWLGKAIGKKLYPFAGLYDDDPDYKTGV